MEDILTSIRTGVAEETAKVADGDVLALSADDMMEANGNKNGHPAVAGSDEELIDINAFATSGEQKPADAAALAAAGDVLGENAALATEVKPAPAAAPVAGEAKAADDEFDLCLRGA